MDRLLFVLLLALAKGEEEATVETVRDDVETVGGVWGRVRDPESPLVHLQVRITRTMRLDITVNTKIVSLTGSWQSPWLTEPCP